jgi:WD40 repeat protein
MDDILLLVVRSCLFCVLYNMLTNLQTGDDQQIIIWDLAAGKKFRTFSDHHDKTIWTLDFSAEGLNFVCIFLS